MKHTRAREQPARIAAGGFEPVAAGPNPGDLFVDDGRWSETKIEQEEYNEQNNNEQRHEVPCAQAPQYGGSPARDIKRPVAEHREHVVHRLRPLVGILAETLFAELHK